MDPRPKANLVVEEVDDETLVYDLDQHRAHCLNPTAGFLFRSADGRRSVADLTSMVEREFGAASPEVVRLGLERLRKAGLLAWEAAPERDPVSRRQMLQRVAVLGILLPTVMTLVSPFPAQAATYILNSACNLANVGKCCKKGKLCIKNKKKRYRCQGAPC